MNDSLPFSCFVVRCAAFIRLAGVRLTGIRLGSMRLGSMLMLASACPLLSLHAQHPRQIHISAVVVPVVGATNDSIRTIIQRDLDDGDRVRVLSVDSAGQALFVVRGERTAGALTVTLVNGQSHAIEQSKTFSLPIVVPLRRQALADSLDRALATQQAHAHAQLVQGRVVYDSLLAATPRKPKYLEDTVARARYKRAISVRDSLMRQLLYIDSLTRQRARRDTMVDDSIRPVIFARDSVVHDSLARAYRWAIHGVADVIQQWMTGYRGVAQSRIAYVSKGEIHVVDMDGANDHVVTSGVGDALSPAWRYDGRAIVYADMRRHGTRIAEVDVEHGTTSVLACTRHGLNITPTYSPDGQWIVYGAARDGHIALAVVRADSTNATRPVRYINVGLGADNLSPVFSPNGHRVAFVSSQGGLPDLYSVRFDGSDEQHEVPLTSGGPRYLAGPDWSPDGQMLAYEQQKGVFQVWAIDRTTKVARQLTSAGQNEDPTWAPDSRHLALTSNRNGSKEIWIFDTVSGRYRQLTFAGDARLAAWSPLLPR